jgi:hypothetical protein
MRKQTLLACIGIAIGSFTVGARANTVTYSGSIALSRTNWTSSVSVPKFDPALGTLNSIEFTLDGFVDGSASFENKNGPVTVKMHLQAQETLYRPDFSTLVVTIPVAMTSDAVTGFDQTIDFGGTSGRTYSLLSASASNSFTTTSVLDEALFTGLGNIVLPVDAQGTSFGSGSGSMVLRFITSASAKATVTYDYNAVPEPATITMSILALGAVGWRLLLRRREQAKGQAD